MVIRTLAAALIWFILAWPVLVFAQGYGLYEHSACVMGRAGAGVAAPCDDGSAIFFNPAGLAAVPGGVASIGVTAVQPRGRFTNETTGQVSSLNRRTYLIPTLYLAAPVRRIVAGVGVFAPYGLTSDWPTSSEGRFLGYRSSLQGIYVQPTVAARINRFLLIGGGLDLTRLSIELRRRQDLSALPVGGSSTITFGNLGVPAGTDMADLKLTGSGLSIGAHVGAILDVNGAVSFGARYLTRQHASIDDADVSTIQLATGLVLRTPLPGLPAGTPIDPLLSPQFSPGRPLGPQSAATTIPLPDQLVAGAAVSLGPRNTLLIDYQFVNWSLFDEVVIRNEFAPPTILVERYRDSHGVRISADHRFTRDAVIRGGFDAHTAGAPDQSVTPLLPEAARREYTLGASLPLSGRLRVDVAYQYVNQQDRRGRTTDGGLAVPTAEVNNGVYHYYAHLFGTSFVLRF